MDLRQHAVEETAFLHLRGPDDALLFDGDKPVGITLYSPGSKPNARAHAAKASRALARMKRGGKEEHTADEIIEDSAIFLAGCTHSFQGIERDGLEGEALYLETYKDKAIGFIAEQASRFLGDWANFTKGSRKS